MCGIVGYIGKKEACTIVLEGLKKLEYRGYDSAGIALISTGGMELVKGVGEITSLEQKIGSHRPSGCVGIGHTRWATHGCPSDNNAHPHSSCSNDFAVVHNGIIENYPQLKNRLLAEGHTFTSETDTEVLAHLVEHYYQGDLLDAVKKAVAQVSGSYALVVLTPKEPERLICARKDSPLIIGLGDDEFLVASDFPALLGHTRRTLILEDGEMAEITPQGVRIFDRQGLDIEKEIFEVTWDAVAAEKGGYPHFMIKEIHEQPQAVQETLRGRIDSIASTVQLNLKNISDDELKKITKIFIVGCGTAYHAGVIGKYVLEKLVRLPVEIDLASEFRYRDPLLNEDSLAIIISQSGETADTLAALRLIRRKGVKVLAITNVVGSSVAREADEVLFTWAGPEIAVASTKAYLTQLIVIYLFTLYLAEKRGKLTRKELSSYLDSLRTLPGKIRQILDNTEAVKNFAENYLAPRENVFYIGRNLDYAVALEGSLKLKEVSYIHTEAYAAGELKHGTMALIVQGIPIVALATQEELLEKTMNNIKEVKARGAYVFSLAFSNGEAMEEAADETYLLPRVEDIFAPVLAVIPLQLIAYYPPVARGCSVDKPRNLAKSVTVE